MDSTSKASSLSTMHRHEKKEVGQPLTRITEDSEPTTAINERNTINENGLSAGQQMSKQFKSSRKAVHLKVAEMEQKYPRVDFPVMRALHIDLDPPKADPEMVAMKEENRQRALLREKEKRRLRKMYTMALTHQASTKRIIDQNEDFSKVINKLCIADVGSMLHIPYEQDPSLYGYPSYTSVLPLPLPNLRNNPLTLPSLEITGLLEDHTIPEERVEDMKSLSYSACSIGDPSLYSCPSSDSAVLLPLLSQWNNRLTMPQSENTRLLEDHTISEERVEAMKSLRHSAGNIKTKSAKSRCQQSGSRQNRRRNESQLERFAGGKPSKAVPLTIDSVKEEEGTVVKDVACLSALWTNYTHVPPTMR